MLSRALFLLFLFSPVGGVCVLALLYFLSPALIAPCAILRQLALLPCCFVFWDRIRARKPGGWVVRALAVSCVCGMIAYSVWQDKVNEQLAAMIEGERPKTPPKKNRKAAHGPGARETTPVQPNRHGHMHPSYYTTA